MKLKKIKIPEFINHDDFGSFKARDVEILFDPNENVITSENFDQEKHSYSLSSEEIDRLTKEAAQRFFDENASTLIRGKRAVKPKEINAIKSFLKISGTELGHLIGLDKSSISRILAGSGEQKLQKDKLMLLLERLKDELEHPGKAKITLHHLREGVSSSKRIEQLCISSSIVAEYFIRKLSKAHSPFTHLKLQKLLYYAQGIGFGRADLKLIKEPFFAWEHGPVIREVYNTYRTFGDSPLSKDDSLDLTPIYSNDVVVALLEETVSLYGIYDAWYLVNKTHNEMPWMETPRDEVISDEKLIRFFKRALV